MRSVEKYLDKRSATREPKRKNDKPEKRVEKDVMAWLQGHGFSCSVVEAKAVYSKARGAYHRGQTVAGFPDVVGCDQFGTAVFIELKAPGRRSTVSAGQRAFLEEKINLGAFGCVVDSTINLEETYKTWLDLTLDPAKRMESIHFLIENLPKKRLKGTKTTKTIDGDEFLW